jgi:hypothetical protein
VNGSCGGAPVVSCVNESSSVGFVSAYLLVFYATS